jgi:hypothetical protein
MMMPMLGATESLQSYIFQLVHQVRHGLARPADWLQESTVLPWTIGKRYASMLARAQIQTIRLAMHPMRKCNLEGAKWAAGPVTIPSSEI